MAPIEAADQQTVYEDLLRRRLEASINDPMEAPPGFEGAKQYFEGFRAAADATLLRLTERHEGWGTWKELMQTVLQDVAVRDGEFNLGVWNCIMSISFFEQAVRAALGHKQLAHYAR